MNRLLFAFLLAPIFFFSKKTNAQGCSDAGVCSMGSLESTQHKESFRSGFSVAHMIGMGEHYEAGEKKTILNTVRFGGRVLLFKNTLLDVKIPVTFVDGDLGKTSGFGDLTVSLSQSLKKTENYHLLLSVGAKIRTGRADKSQDGRTFPMTYQTSLGTNDLLLGLSFFYEKWQFSAGYQHPFNRNQNRFLRSTWEDNEDAQDYFESNRLQRGDDIILRIEKRWEFKRFDFFFGALPMLRLQKDEIIKDGQTIKLPGSDALTLNLNVSARYPVNERINLRMTYASPVKWRKTRADGLERVFVLTTGVDVRF